MAFNFGPAVSTLPGADFLERQYQSSLRSGRRSFYLPPQSTGRARNPGFLPQFQQRQQGLMMGGVTDAPQRPLLDSTTTASPQLGQEVPLDPLSTGRGFYNNYQVGQGFHEMFSGVPSRGNPVNFGQFGELGLGVNTTGFGPTNFATTGRAIPTSYELEAAGVDAASATGSTAAAEGSSTGGAASSGGGLAGATAIPAIGSLINMGTRLSNGEPFFQAWVNSAKDFITFGLVEDADFGF